MEPHDIQIGIIGCGKMGTGLAQLFASYGFSVTLVEKDEALLEKGLQRLNRFFDRAVEKNVISKSEAAQCSSRIHGSLKLSDLGATDLAIEAIFEDLTLKNQLFHTLSKECGTRPIFATNTSSFKVAEIFANTDLWEQGRAVGLHFFYPANQNRLVEVITPSTVNASKRNWLLDLMRHMGRVVIECEDSWGFVVNRYFVPWLNEAVRLFDNNMGTVSQLDAISKRACDASQGAFEIMNLTGLAPVLHAMRTFYQHLGPDYKPARGLEAQLDSGKWDLEKKAEGTVKVVSPEFSIFKLHYKAIQAITELLDAKVCDENDIIIGAKIGLQWRLDPISRTRAWAEKDMDVAKKLLAKEETVVEGIQSFHQRMNAWPGRNYVTTETRDSTRIIYLRRPEAMNALNEKMLEDIETAFVAAENDAAVEMIVFRGCGKMFAAGGDLHFIRNAIREARFDQTDAYFSKAQQLFSKIDGSNKTVIAYVEGMALGGGVQLALASDLIIATPRASFEFPETGLGLFPGLGGTQRLPKRIGRELSKYLIFTGARIDAIEASAIGLVDAILVDLDWLPKTKSIAKNIDTIRGERAEKTMPVNMMQVAALMNSKNVSRLIQKKSIQSLPEGMLEIYDLTKDKHPFALQTANALIDKGESINLEAGLKQELSALKAICRNKETISRLLDKPS